MSRIGRKPVALPAGVEVLVDDNNLVVVKGPRGELRRGPGGRGMTKIVPPSAHDVHLDADSDEPQPEFLAAEMEG